MSHPYRDAAIVGIYNSRQARTLDTDSRTLALDVAEGALADASVRRDTVDGVVGDHALEIAYDLGIGPVWISHEQPGIRGLVHAIEAIR
jgi:hypothetical protein